ncbi:acyl-CoA dehydrogenase [Caballeronia sp. RCC_10]|uniref:acyl-CoA dehydrogenase n=1 Tax=Caballeronia sp. RCC_10 TaxID=3239227 RepID=UPI0035266E72
MNDMTRGPRKRAIPASWRVHKEDAFNATLEEVLAGVLFTDDRCASRVATLNELRGLDLDRLPLPGSGNTATRWGALGAVAACDLSLAKLYESHADALAILAELHCAEHAPRGTWAIWAAEPPNARLVARTVNGQSLLLDGTKAWCSGASHITHALVTAWRNDEPVLAAVNLSQQGIEIDESGWQAVGMRATGTASVRFDGVQATLIGDAEAYVNRPGFWHGGAGIAACWLGSAAAIATTLIDNVARRDDPHALAHLGAVDAALASAAALLRETAASIDAHPSYSAQQGALRARVAVDRVAMDVITHVTRAIGPAPACTDAWLARALADLPIFVRQSHAERDEAALAKTLIDDYARSNR